MSHRILAALIATGLACACSERSQPTASARREAPPTVVSIPVPSSAVAAAAPLPEPPKDGLALAHIHRPSMNHRQRWEELRRLGEISSALDEARAALHDDPSDEEATRTVARLARLEGKRELAATAFERLGQLRPEDSVPLVQQARILASLEDYEGAYKLAEEAAHRDPNNPESFQVLGRAALGLTHLEEAIGHFKHALELAPDHGYAWNNLGFSLLRANRNDEAVEALSQAVLLLPQVAYVHNNLGIALERTERVEEAKLAFARATSLSPKYVKAQINAQRLAKVTVVDFTQEGEQALDLTGGEGDAEQGPDLAEEE